LARRPRYRIYHKTDVDMIYKNDLRPAIREVENKNSTNKRLNARTTCVSVLLAFKKYHRKEYHVPEYALQKGLTRKPANIFAISSSVSFPVEFKYKTGIV